MLVTETVIARCVDGRRVSVRRGPNRAARRSSAFEASRLAATRRTAPRTPRSETRASCSPLRQSSWRSCSRSASRAWRRRANSGTPGTPESSISDLAALAAHLETHHEAFAGAIEVLRKSAAAELQRREDRWRPIATALSEWTQSAREARAGAEDLPRIKAAETWLKDASADIRNERFAPIADKAMATWEHLRQQSNVTLGRIELVGRKSQRRVTLDVTVDGIPGAALGVMSQGELHSLALSLFLPRATLSESPFRFVVIDDPVQSMDPARVDGLARALEDTARTRQVIVFTHDERLPEAVRRLGIKSTILSITRRPKSVVEVRTALDPVRAHIEDALALVHTTELPKEVLRSLVPGFCRSALEASFISVVRRRRLAAGRLHGEVEEELKECRQAHAARGAGVVRRQGQGRRRHEAAEPVRLVGRRRVQAVARMACTRPSQGTCS